MEALGLESCRSIARGSKRLYNNREEIAQLRGHFNITWDRDDIPAFYVP